MFRSVAVGARHQGMTTISTDTHEQHDAAPAAPAAWRLTWLSGPDAGRTSVVGDGRWLIGRAHLADVRCADPALEPFHAEVTLWPHGEVALQQLAGRTPIRRTGAVVELGASSLSIERGERAPVGEPTTAGGVVVRPPRTPAVWNEPALVVPVAPRTADHPPPSVTVLVIAVGLPLTRLIIWAREAADTGATQTVAGGLWHHTSGTLVVAFFAAVTCIGLGTLLALLARRRGTIGRFVGRVAALGYAMPGPVVAVGAVITLAALDRSGVVSSGFVFVGSLAGLVFALTVRFLAVALHGVESGLERVPPSTIASARMLGARPVRVAWSVEIPAARASIVAAGALLLIDLMKELPITLLLRPFGFDTLAVWVWQATSESLWAQAALPSLTIVVVGMCAIGALLTALDRGAEVAS